MCRDNGLVPKFARIVPVKCIRDYSEFFRIANDKLLRRVISDYRQKVMFNNKALYELHLQLAKTLHNDLWERLDAMSFNRTNTIANTIQKRHDKKFYNLQEKYGSKIKCYSQNVNIEKAQSNLRENIVNLSSQQLSNHAISVLSKGLNFAPTPRKIPMENIITSVEDAVVRNRIPQQDAECLRQDIATMLRKFKPPKCNLTRDEMTALFDLRSNTDLLILPADKGNATVVVDTDEYETKITRLVSDETTYKKVNYNPTSRVTSKVIKLLHKSTDVDLLARLRPHNPTSPKIYGLPKIHKPNWPLRPIVSQIDAPTYKLSKHLATVLQRFTGNTDSYIKDSRHFVQMLAGVRILPTEIMVSFDVTSLFTNVPVDDTITIIADLIRGADLPTEYIEFTECCLKNGYFLWRGEHFLQVDGIAMGSPVAPVVANIFMEWFEAEAIKNISVRPSYWWRYVDDVFAIIAKDALTSFTSHLNTVHRRIQFTVEEEQNGVLPFLDVQVFRKPDGSISHSVHRKLTHTDRYLRADSHHHPSQLASVPKSLINRALSLCDPQYLSMELDHVKQVLEQNGYKWRQCLRWANGTERKSLTTVNRAPIYLPYVKGVTDKIGFLLRRKYNIRTFFRPPSQLRQLLRSPKDKEPLNVPGVYKIPCECGKCYIGETRRNIATRLTEHIRSVKNADTCRSAVAEHAQEPNHFLRFDKASVLANEKFLVPRKVREAIEIDRHPNFNRDRGWTLPQAWKPVLNISSQNNSVEIVLQDTVSVVCTEFETTSSDECGSSSAPVAVTSQRAARAAARAARAAAAATDPSSACADTVGSARVAL